MGDIVINKQGLIFLTLTSLILVLSVYYVTMPNELLLTTNSSYINDDKLVNNDSNDSEKVVIEDVNTLEAMKTLLNDERMEELGKLKKELMKKELSLEEKNNVYEEIKNINKIEAKEEEIEKLIKKEFNLESFVKINNDIVEVVINNLKHDTNLAVKIMTSIEKVYPNMYISISFKA